MPMAIPVSSVVDVAISIGASFPQRPGFGTLCIVTAEQGVIAAAERIRYYSNIDGVAEDWPADSEALAAATSYFSQQPKPTDLKIAMRFDEDRPAELRGAVIVDADLATLLAVTDGSFQITMDGNVKTVQAIDLSGESDLTQVAARIQSSLRAFGEGAFTEAVCIAGVDGRLYVGTGTLGVNSTISFASPASPSVGTDISGLLALQQGQATITNGRAAESITEALSAIQDVDGDWYGLHFTKEVRDSATFAGEPAVMAAAAWCEARVKVLFNTSNDPAILDSVSASDIATELKSKSYRRTITSYSSYPDEYPSASVAARAFTVNFSQPDSTITLKFKKLPGVTVEDLRQSELATLEGKSANALINVGGSFFFSQSCMSDCTFFDEVHGVDWLTAAVQYNVFGYLQSRIKVAYTNKGASALAQQVRKALDEGVRNGLLAPGYTLDELYLPDGYAITTLPVEDIDQGNVEARHYPGLSFVCLGAGAIHSVQIQGVFER